MLPSQVSPPDFATSSAPPSGINGVEIVALPVFAGADGVVLGPGAATLADGVGIDLFEVLDFAGATGAVGEVTRIPVAGAADNPSLRLIVLAGVGEGRLDGVRRAAAEVARVARNRASVATTLHLVSPADTDPALAVEAAIAGFVLGSFAFHMRSDGPPFVPVPHVVLALSDESVTEAVDAGLALAGASWRARVLSTVPANIKNPAWFADQARDVAQAHNIDIEVMEYDDLVKGGFGGLLGVGAASPWAPRMVRLTYKPRRSIKSKGHVVLVGKGITFDSGGLSIKPGESMATMKRDMTGGAVVLAVMAALVEVDCPVKVTGLICLAENVISGDALRPGDVLTHYNGRTTEVTNTDAEGRLVLADGLAFAVDKLKPDVLVDVATLTGGIRVALGQHLAGLFSNDEDLAAHLAAAGEEAGEPTWRMPLAAIYEERLASKIADADNCPPVASGITAALFLQHFVGEVPWAHLDIASVGDAVKDEGEWTAGPTGFGARLLLRWLRDPLPKGS